jgi:hypothetical protein
MTDEASYLGFDREQSEGYLQPDMVRVWFLCDHCGHEYSHVYRAIPKRNAPCPQRACVDRREMAQRLKQARNAQAMIESGQTPGITGRNPVVGIIDQTAQDVMSDYKLTDLKDNIRPGEAMAPSLPGKGQVAADNFFSAGAGATGMGKKQADFVSRRAMQGAYRHMAVAPTDVFPGQKGESPLWRVPRRT